MIHAYCDGSVTGGSYGSRKEPRQPIATWIGWVACRPDGELISHHSYKMGEREDLTISQAEFFAIGSVLRWLYQNRYEGEDIAVFSDSECAIKAHKGVNQTHNPVLAKMLGMNMQVAAKFKSVGYAWIPRLKNQLADRLSKSLQPKYEGRDLTREEVENLLKELAAGKDIS
jgi:ribonuclease HI